MCSVVLRDGSYECKVVYGNISEAKRAVRLSGTELGDRSFTVEMVQSSADRFRSRSSEGSGAGVGVGVDGRKIAKEAVKTAIVWGLAERERQRRTEHQQTAAQPREDRERKKDREEGEKDRDKDRAKEKDREQEEVEKVVALCGGRDVVIDVRLLEGSKGALVEFVDRATMLLAFERLKIATLPNGSRAKYAGRRSRP